MANKFTGLFKKNRISREEAIVVSGKGNTEFDESYNRLKDNVIYYSNDGENKVIQIDSSIAGEGKTTLTCNLGVSLALNDKKVAIVDLDFRKARVHRAFKVSSETGLGDYMAGDATLDNIIKHTKYGVDIITRGKHIYNASLVLTSDKMDALIKTLKERYDFILLDCPPVLLISDYINITKFADGLIFVVAAGYTKKSAVKEAYSLLARTGVKIIGAVMTFAEHVQGYYSYYKYGKYGKYGNKYGYGYGYYRYGDKEENEKTDGDRKAAEKTDGKK